MSSFVFNFYQSISGKCQSFLEMWFLRLVDLNCSKSRLLVMASYKGGFIHVGHHIAVIRIKENLN